MGSLGESRHQSKSVADVLYLSWHSLFETSKLPVANKLYSYIHCELKRKWNPIEGAEIVWELIVREM